jgi:serine protease Do
VGEVIGINTAISSKGSNIGFAVPIDTAKDILPQLEERGRVLRGFIGVMLTDVNPDLQRSLHLPLSEGALVQDVTAGSPGERAGLRPYDLIVSVDDEPVRTYDQLIHTISARAPGTAARLRFVRDGGERSVIVKLAARPSRGNDSDPERPEPRVRRAGAANPLGLSVSNLDRDTVDRLQLPPGIKGVLVTGVEPTSASFDADVERGNVLLEINRQRVESVNEFNRVASAARPGDILTLYVYSPAAEQRQLKTIRVDDQ